MSLAFICVDISMDGLYVITGTDEGKIYLFEGKTIGVKNMLLTYIRISDFGLVSCKWFSYNGDFSS